MCWHKNCKLTNLAARKGFLRLIKELSAAFKPKGWLLSTTVSANPMTINGIQEVSEITRYFDFITLITHDFDRTFGDPAFGDVTQLNIFDSFDIENTVKYWLRRKAPAEKLLLGISSGGQSFTVENLNGNGKKELNLGMPGVLTNTLGSLAYFEICNNTKNNGWKVRRSQEIGIGPHAYHDDQLVFYDDVNDIRAKAKYIRAMGLGGGSMWTLDFDDFRGSCGCGKYPLLTTLSQEIANAGGKSIPNCT